MYNKGHVPKTARVDHSWKLTCSVVGNNAKYLWKNITFDGVKYEVN